MRRLLLPLLLLNISSGLLRRAPLPAPGRRRVMQLPMSNRDGSSSGLSLKVLGVGLIAAVGVFGSDFFGTVGTVVQGAKQATIATSAPTLKQGAGETRGAMTRLTRREINEKLAQVPVFFVVNAAGGIDVKDGIGYIFSNRNDAEQFAKGSTATVGAATLDDVFYTLIEKKTKLSMVGGVVGKSDPDATYQLRPSPVETKETTTEFQQAHPNDFPLFRVSNLAFQKEEGVEIPFFLRKVDALGAFERLQTSKGAVAGGGVPAPDIQVTSCLTLVKLFSSGGFEGRAIELFPSIDEIDNYKALVRSP